MPWFPLVCHFIACLGLRVLFCTEIPPGPYQLLLQLPALSHILLLLFFLLSHYNYVSGRGQLIWEVLPINSPSSAHFSPLPLCLSLPVLLQLHSDSTTRDAEQGTKGAFSGPLRGPLPLLSDLSPNLEYMFVHRCACTKCRLQPRYSRHWCFSHLFSYSWVTDPTGGGGGGGGLLDGSCNFTTLDFTVMLCFLICDLVIVAVYAKKNKK